ncbi:Uma2 family endonuclease [Stieleria sp. ICT_E10.1]|uniref:Uma2 family endonuclease n=1 Tax=Stieleria sedimenti TaxID=2976331 RepID=UPI00217F818F|nr:Uma2 family endonuclease [Stieleria sedimenti]MCS7465381.1 Uma2 family endonuclease [Stieleria sedimenti]
MRRQLGESKIVGIPINSTKQVELWMSFQTETPGKLGYAHYVGFPDDGRRHEIIDGDHYVYPAPSTYHQTVSKRLQYQLYTQFELAGKGLVFDAPVDVQLTAHDIVQPDLVVILNAKTQMITPTKIKGIPDLIVEIVSPSSSDNDRKLKKQLYERVGVTEYWIADPFEHLIEQWVLQSGGYQMQPAADPLCPTIDPEVRVPMNEIW